MFATIPNEHERKQAELLDSYWQHVSVDLNAEAPDELDARLAAFTSQLAEEGMAPPQDAESTARVRNRVQAALDASTHKKTGASQTARQDSTPWWRSPILGGQLRGAAALAVLVVATLAVYLVGFRPPEVSAAVVLERAEAAARSPLTGGIRTFSFKTVEQQWRATARGLMETRVDSTRWYSGPILWRNETRQQIIDSAGTATIQAAGVEVSDGTDFWQYDALRNWVQVQPTAPELGGQGHVGIFGQGLVDLGSLLSEASRCYEPKHAGSDRIAGRPTYKIDLGRTKCPAAALPEFAGPQMLWVDKTTSFILAWELYDRDGKNRVAASEVTEIAYNQEISPERLQFTTPAGALISDLRPKALIGVSSSADPSAVEAALRSAVESLASSVQYDALVPAYAPAGLAPRQPSLRFVDIDRGDGASPERIAVVRIEYLPTDLVQSETNAMGPGIVIDQQRLPNATVAEWTAGLAPTTIGGHTGWYREGERNADGTGTNSVVHVLQDGLLITLGSFDVPLEELMRVAESMRR